MIAKDYSKKKRRVWPPRRPNSEGMNVSKLKELLKKDQDGLCAYCAEEITKGRIYRNHDHGVICQSCYALIGSGRKGIDIDAVREEQAAEVLQAFAEWAGNAYTGNVEGGEYDKETVADRKLTYDQVCAKVSDELERFFASGGCVPSPDALEVLGDVLDAQARRIEHKRAKTLPNVLTREEWAEREAEYVDYPYFINRHGKKTQYVPMSVPYIEDKYKTYYERGLLTERELTRLLGNFRECAYRFCFAAFDKSKEHGHTKHCCPAHREAEKNAKKRFKKTGTYLPEDAYLVKTARTVEEDAIKHETAFNDTFINRYSKKKGEVFASRPGGKMSTRTEMRKVRERMYRNSQIHAQLKKYRRFVKGEGNSWLKVDIKSGKIIEKRPLNGSFTGFLVV
jgi:hypothetical protein